MSLAQDHEMIEAFTPDRPDQPFCKAVLPGRSRRYGLVADAHGTNPAQGNLAIDAVVISDQIAWRLVPRERLGERVRDTFGGRISCHVNPDQRSAAQPDYDEAIKQAEPNCRDRKQIHGRDFGGVIPQKGAPSLTGRSISLDHVLSHRRLGDLKAELEQFAMDTRSSL